MSLYFIAFIVILFNTVIFYMVSDGHILGMIFCSIWVYFTGDIVCASFVPIIWFILYAYIKHHQKKNGNEKSRPEAAKKR